MKTLLLLAIAALVAAKSYATVTLEFWAADLQNSSGNLMPTTGLVIITSSTNSTFSAGHSLPPYTPLFVGAAFSPTEQIIYRSTLESGSGPGVFDRTIDFTLSGGFLATGDKLAIYWFPDLTAATVTLGYTQIGFFRTDDVVDGSSISWQMPNDGTINWLYFVTENEGGSQPQTAGRAEFLDPIPEPSTMTLVALSLAGVMTILRRR